jgi:hypothetical protein
MSLVSCSPPIIFPLAPFASCVFSHKQDPPHSGTAQAVRLFKDEAVQCVLSVSGLLFLCSGTAQAVR